MSSINWKSLLTGLAIGALVVAATPVVADVGDAVIQGQGNVVDVRTTLRGETPGANLRLIQQKAGTAALSIFTEPLTPPLKVNRKAKVENLNADLLDGRSAGFFAPRVPRPGNTLAGAWAGNSPSSHIMAPVTFSPALPHGIPNANMHYLAQGADPTAECPGAPEAAPGHLCVYTSFTNGVSFQQFVSIVDPFSDADATEHGFVIHLSATSDFGNARGTWAYTVPASPPALGVIGPSAATEATDPR